MGMLPFLYLPDTVTLVLLIVILGMLRGLAIDHIRQELQSIRKEMLFYWLSNGLDFRDQGYLALRNQIESAIELAPGLSPGRLLFLYRLHKKAAKNETILPLPDPIHDVGLRIELTTNSGGREKLKRLQMEMNLALGMFFLMGSLSGWFLLSILAARMLKGTVSHYQDHRTDIFFDMVEKVLGVLGRKAQQIGYAAQGVAIQ